MRNKVFPFLFIFVLLISACQKSNDSNIKKDGLISCELVGELKHTQYWDDNDSWDLRSISLQLNYSDETVTIPAINEYTTYSFSPSSPVGLDHSINSFTVTGGTYIDYLGKNHSVSPRVFENITIIDYPYKNSMSSQTKKIISFIFLTFFFLLVLGFVIILIVRYKKNQNCDKAINDL